LSQGRGAQGYPSPDEEGGKKKKERPWAKSNSYTVFSFIRRSRRAAWLRAQKKKEKKRKKKKERRGGSGAQNDRS